MGYEESAVLGTLGGGYGEPPVRVADLEAAARRRAAARQAERERLAKADRPDPEPAAPAASPES
ncbi:hypothetical protein Cs7R123_78970 [Catellatospora sp. TT07R-123]|uniref:hypothetical protein n=1 Tax=Catellatospora sp. TT07R-123 TaxID=2733863 RepID=UPI001B299126|nr:hypothetical protein [Catellatospora sp. TT07R-123]GHJ50555.1 hypothetical protein Cs7R123_78970 [Catellatospora sp. TT07R-123]